MTALASGEGRRPAGVCKVWLADCSGGRRWGKPPPSHGHTQLGKAHYKVSVAPLIVSVWLEDSHACYTSSPHTFLRVDAQPRRPMLRYSHGKKLTFSDVGFKVSFLKEYENRIIPAMISME